MKTTEPKLQLLPITREVPKRVPRERPYALEPCKESGVQTLVLSTENTSKPKEIITIDKKEKLPSQNLPNFFWLMIH